MAISNLSVVSVPVSDQDPDGNGWVLQQDTPGSGS